MVAIGTGAMFSSGFFLLPGIAFAATGPSMPLAYLLGGLLALPTMLAVAELSTAMPRAGGPYHFFERSMGTRVAVVGALGLWLALVGKAAFALAGIDAYLGLLVELPAALPALVLAVAFTVANVVGARESARVQLALVVLLLAVLLVTTITGVVDVARSDADVGQRLTPFFSEGALGLFAAVALVFVSFAGIPQIASVAGEVKDPDRSIPRGILVSLAIGTTAYVVGTLLMVLTLPAAELRDDLTPVASAVADGLLPLGELLVVVAALAAFASTANAGIMSAARYPLTLARDRALWSPFARLNAAGTPWVSTLATGGAVAFVVVAFDTDRIARLASAIVLLAFAMLNLAVLVLRRARAIGYHPTFRTPGYPWVPLAGAVVTVPLIVDLGVEPVMLVLAVVLGGSLWSHVVARRGAAGTRDRGALLHLVHRSRLGTVDDATVGHRLQEMGPRPGDDAPGLIASLDVELLDDSATERAIDVATRLVAERLDVSVGTFRAWARRPHLRLRPEEGLDVLGLLHDGDQAVGAIVVAPDAIAVVLALADDEHEQLDRLGALLAAQFIDGEPLSAADQGPVALREALASDASRRQGADPPRH